MFETLWGQVLNTTPLEWAAIATTALCIFLAGRNNIHTWWTGIVACSLYMVLFYQIKLYADVALQVFFIATSIIGWIGWKVAAGDAGAQRTSDWLYVQLKRVGLGDLLQTTAAPLRQSPSARSIMIFAVIGLLTYAGYSAVLIHYADAAAPLLDSAVLVLSVIAQLWMMRRYVVSWPLWIAVNTVAVPLFYSRDLVMTSLVYAIFWLHAWYGWYHWHTTLGREKSFK